ncbi:MAG: hypothetical protein ACRDH5_10230 [bacterium]
MKPQRRQADLASPVADPAGGVAQARRQTGEEGHRRDHGDGHGRECETPGSGGGEAHDPMVRAPDARRYRV